MKIIKTIFIVFLAVFILGCVGLFIFIKTFDVNKYLPQMTEQVSQSLHRPFHVDHGGLSFGFTTGIAIQLDGLKIGNDPQVSRDDLLTAQEVDVQLDLMGLLQKQIHVNLIDVKQIQVTIEDPKSKIATHIIVDDLQAKAKNFSLSDPFDFTIDLKAYSTNPMNIHVTGRCTLDISKSKVHIDDLKVQSDLNQWDFNKVKTISSTFQTIPLPKEVKGQVDLEIPTLDASAQGLDSVSSNLKISIGEGQINVVSQITELSKIPHYTFQIGVKSLKIEELVDESAWPGQVKGALVGNFSGTGDSFESEAMQANLTGSGDFSLTDGRIEKLNILKLISDKLSFIPGLSDKINNSLSTQVKDKLNQETTLLDKAQSKITLLNKVTSIDADVESKVFSVIAQGTVGFDQMMNIDVKAYLAADVSADLAKSVQLLQALLDDQGRIYVPGTVSGKIPAVSYKPQIDYVTKKIAVLEGSTQLQKVLDKNPGVRNILNAVLGTKEGQSTDSNPENQTNDDSSKQTISNVLNKIFK